MKRDFGELIRVVIECGALMVQMRRREQRQAWEAEEATYKPADGFVPGDRVALRGRALFSMGAMTGPLGEQCWTVVVCQCELCQLGRHVAIGPRRHIARAALRHHGQPCVDELRVVDGDEQRVALVRGLQRALRRGC